ncbi:hypothetical protein HEK616_35100 [Streptomyces nigrescens]|uniref:Uncharacterized protein n=1 Tax=Streptomyces nigrescens TaxID=1920 RepID=A0ABM7ZV35_STRNI|nr:hypothetical protein HEK616_35100 [Streptomyces nigrescens]
MRFHWCAQRQRMLISLRSQMTIQPRPAPRRLFQSGGQGIPVGFAQHVVGVLGQGGFDGAGIPLSNGFGDATATGRPQTPRDTLRERVRQALAGALGRGGILPPPRRGRPRGEKRLAPCGDTLGYNGPCPRCSGPT